MALNEYICAKCGLRQLAFENELTQGNCGTIIRWCHDFVKMPPKVQVITATAMYMHEYQLDSFHTVYELDRQLNIEARNEKEMEVYQIFKRNA